MRKEEIMAKTVKMCDMSKYIAAKVFQMLNGQENVLIQEPDMFCELAIVTNIEPRDLVYPEGWYYANGFLRNKHTSTTGLYEEIPMIRPNGDDWSDYALYCTLEK